MIQRGIRGKDGNPILKPVVGPPPTIDEVKEQLRQMMMTSPKNAPTTYPPMPDTTPPKQPSDPQNPPPLPIEEEDSPGDEPEDEEDIEDDNWEDQEEDDDGQKALEREAEQVADGPSDVQGAPPDTKTKVELALERQRKEDAERYGGTMGATVMESARKAPPGATIPQMDEQKLHELATAKGLDADKVVRASRRAMLKWQAYAEDIRERAEEGEDIPASELEEMKRLGIEAVKWPAQVLGIQPVELQRMIDDLADPTAQAKLQSDKDAEEMYQQSLLIVKDTIDKLQDPHKVLAALTGATALHILGFHDSGYRRKVITEHAAHLLQACADHEKEEAAAKNGTP
jgi:hypothetical protein